ncbi:hypothetical protein ABID27_000445 [Streptococcus gallinaceus]|uniref:Uncharacterized protein n=1 Tax=Streptococcus gallinaceus TaxID=165758 RepID=A0ABV2JLP3_9STRE
MKDHSVSFFSQVRTWGLIILVFIITVIILATTGSKLIGIVFFVGVLAGADWFSNKLKSRKVMNTDAEFFKQS